MEEKEITTGPGIRTWQFAQTIARAGYRVTLICLRDQGAYRSHNVRAKNFSPLSVTHPLENITYHNVHYDTFTDTTTVKKIAAQSKPIAIAGVGSLLPVATAVTLRDIAPVWADFFGDPFTEIQAKARVYPTPESDTELFHVWKMYRNVILHADTFSAVSNPQRFALIGHLSFCGRLNRHTPEYEFVHVVPCGIDPDTVPDVDKTVPPVVRGKDFDEGDCIVFWAGSYNTWADTDTLFKGVEAAMAQNPRIQYLSIGGGTPGYNEKVFEEFRSKVERSEFKERFTFKGWVPNDELPSYFNDVDVGISIDRRVYESEFGSRNRVLHFLAHGVPVTSTGMCEFVRDMIARDFVTEFQPGDPESLANALVSIAGQEPRARKEHAREGQKAVLEEYSFTRTIRPFLAWLESRPEHAPDALHRRSSATPYLNEIERSIAESGDTARPILRRLFERWFPKV